MPHGPQPAVASAPPHSDTLTAYDRAHFATYLKLLDAVAMDVDWRITARDVLLLDLDANVETARRVYEAHLTRARWMTRVGYRLLLK